PGSRLRGRVPRPEQAYRPRAHAPPAARRISAWDAASCSGTPTWKSTCGATASRSPPGERGALTPLDARPARRAVRGHETHILLRAHPGRVRAEPVAFLGSAAHDGDALHPEHAADLARSGLTDETIRAANLRTIPPGDLTRLVGGFASKISSALLIPY